MERQTREAVQIANTRPTQVLNTRTEYIRPVILRLAYAGLIPDIDRNRGQGTRIRTEFNTFRTNFFLASSLKI